jgi:DNA-binding NtrC family response regulator
MDARSGYFAMKRILVVDDDRQIVQLLRITLEKAGFSVVGAGNGSEALATCQQQTFDLMICDIIMPEKGGVETINEIRRRRPDVKVIAISGGGVVPSDLYLRAVQLLGADRTFPKPFQPTQIVNAVRDLLGEPRKRATAAVAR